MLFLLCTKEKSSGLCGFNKTCHAEVGKMRNCGMRNAESKMRNLKMRKCLRNGG